MPHTHDVVAEVVACDDVLHVCDDRIHHDDDDDGAGDWVPDENPCEQLQDL